MLPTCSWQTDRQISVAFVLFLARSEQFYNPMQLPLTKAVVAPTVALIIHF